MVYITSLTMYSTRYELANVLPCVVQISLVKIWIGSTRHHLQCCSTLTSEGKSWYLSFFNFSVSNLWWSVSCFILESEIVSHDGSKWSMKQLATYSGLLVLKVYITSLRLVMYLITAIYPCTLSTVCGSYSQTISTTTLLKKGQHDKVMSKPSTCYCY